MIVFQVKHIYFVEQIIRKAKSLMQTSGYCKFDGTSFSLKYYSFGKHPYPLVDVIFEWFLSGVSPVFLRGTRT